MSAVQVAVRVRPLSTREVCQGHTSLWTRNGNALCTEKVNLSFDTVFDQNVDNSKIYSETASGLIHSVMNGFNGTIIAYGQTSSGKTHTMCGTSEQPGIIPLAVKDVFDIIQSNHEREYLVRVSYLEIYNEVIKDLLFPENINLKIHENQSRDIWVGNLTETVVSSQAQMHQLMAQGQGNRAVGETNVNEQSSRSHSIFRIIVESRLKCGNSVESIRVSTLNLVDLAGSERVGYTGAEGARLKEAGNINKSLLALGTVIGKLSEGENKHIPYRDSKLTRILQPALGGNSKTAIICTITPSSRFLDESLSTLKFASRAKTIKNKPKLNEVVSDEVLLKQYKKEIDILKMQLNTAKSVDSSIGVLKKDTYDAAKIKEKLDFFNSSILNSVSLKKNSSKRRQTWYPRLHEDLLASEAHNSSDPLLLDSRPTPLPYRRDAQTETNLGKRQADAQTEPDTAYTIIKKKRLDFLRECYFTEIVDNQTNMQMLSSEKEELENYIRALERQVKSSNTAYETTIRELESKIKTASHQNSMLLVEKEEIMQNLESFQRIEEDLIKTHHQKNCEINHLKNQLLQQQSIQMANNVNFKSILLEQLSSSLVSHFLDISISELSTLATSALPNNHILEKTFRDCETQINSFPSINSGIQTDIIPSDDYPRRTRSTLGSNILELSRERIPCPHCERTYVDEARLNRHLKDKHQEFINSDELCKDSHPANKLDGENTDKPIQSQVVRLRKKRIGTQDQKGSSNTNSDSLNDFHNQENSKPIESVLEEKKGSFYDSFLNRKEHLFNENQENSSINSVNDGKLESTKNSFIPLKSRYYDRIIRPLEYSDQHNRRDKSVRTDTNPGMLNALELRRNQCIKKR